MKEKFHERLRRLRDQKGISMKKMAQKIRVPETTYREWEYGRAIRGEPYVAMAEVLDVSLHELMTGAAKAPQRVDAAIREAEDAIKKLKLEVMSFF